MVKELDGIDLDLRDDRMSQGHCEVSFHVLDEQCIVIGPSYTLAQGNGLSICDMVRKKMKEEMVSSRVLL